MLAAAIKEFGYFAPTTIDFLLQNTYSLEISFFYQFKIPVK